MASLLLQVKPLLQVTRQEEEMGQKEEELKTAKDVAAKAEADLKDISQKHTQVDGEGGGNRLTFDLTNQQGENVIVLMFHCS